MKGIVFTEFLDMVESTFGYEVVDHIIEQSDLASDGVYTSVGTYHHSEVVQLLMNLSEKVNIEPMVLLKEFGKYLFDTFLKQYPQFFTSHDNSFDFLMSIDNHIHVEVQKLYPEATLPKFDSEILLSGEMIMIYQSERKMAALAEGLMEKAFAHYGEMCEVKKDVLKEDGSEVKFTITKQ